MSNLSNGSRRHLPSGPVLLCFLLLGSNEAVFGACNPDPVAPQPNVQSTRLVHLSEIGGCENLQCWIGSIANTPFSNGTLIIDEQCTLDDPLVLPSRFTLAGVGRGGEGALVFPTLAPGEAAIQVSPGLAGPSEVEIRDLAIYGPNHAGTGIRLESVNAIHLERVRIAGFRIGVYGREAYSVSITDSLIHSNGYNIVLRRDANTWRIRDNIISQAIEWGLYVGRTAADGVGNNDVLIDGNRFESNGAGAVFLGSLAAFVTHNRFEQNGQPGLGIEIDSVADGNRILSNLFSSDGVSNQGADTQCAFNVGMLGSCP